jgi:hypothetical protein
MLDVMEGHEIKPNVETFNSLIASYDLPAHFSFVVGSSVISGVRLSAM